MCDIAYSLHAVDVNHIFGVRPMHAQLKWMQHIVLHVPDPKCMYIATVKLLEVIIIMPD